MLPTPSSWSNPGSDLSWSFICNFPMIQQFWWWFFKALDLVPQIDLACKVNPVTRIIAWVGERVIRPIISRTSSWLWEIRLKNGDITSRNVIAEAVTWRISTAPAPDPGAGCFNDTGVAIFAVVVEISCQSHLDSITDVYIQSRSGDSFRVRSSRAPIKYKPPYILHSHKYSLALLTHQHTLNTQIRNLTFKNPHKAQIPQDLPS